VSLKLAQQQGAFGAVLAGEPGAEADGAFTRLPRPADLRALADVWFDEGCVVETPTSVTFTDCRWDGGRIDGFARYEGGTLTVDLTVEAAYAGSSFTFRERGSISISDTRIAGDLTIDVDASGGGGWGPVVTSTLMASGKLKPRTIIGTVSMSEFVISVAASVGFLLALGSAGIRWDIVAMMLLGGSIAAPVAAWLVRHFDDRALGAAVGALIILLNIDRLLVLLGLDSSYVMTIRVIAVAAGACIVGLLIWRGRAAREEAVPVGA